MFEQIINFDRMEQAVSLFGSFDENIKKRRSTSKNGVLRLIVYYGETQRYLCLIDVRFCPPTKKQKSRSFVLLFAICHRRIMIRFFACDLRRSSIP